MNHHYVSCKVNDYFKTFSCLVTSNTRFRGGMGEFIQNKKT
jgi:hypothetical protein